MLNAPKPHKIQRHQDRFKKSKKLNARNSPYVGLVILLAGFGLFLQYRYNNKQVQHRKKVLAPLRICTACGSTGVNARYSMSLGNHSQSAFSRTALIINHLNDGIGFDELSCGKCGGSGMLHRRASRERIAAELQETITVQSLVNLVMRPVACETCRGEGIVAPAPPLTGEADLCTTCYGAGFELLPQTLEAWAGALSGPASLIDVEQMIRDKEAKERALEESEAADPSGADAGTL